jgi:hypothetical protein
MHDIRKVLAITLLLALSSIASAQVGGGMRRGGGPANDGDRARQDAAMRGDTMPMMGANDQIQMQLNQVRSALRLAPEQAASWQVYENKVVDLLADVRRGVMQPEGGGALKQIDARIDVVRNRLTALEEIAEAAKKLYASLSEEQKTVADRMLAGTVPALYSGIGMPQRPGGRPSESERRR